MQKIESAMKNPIVHIPKHAQSVFIFISSEPYRHNASLKEQKRWSVVECSRKIQ